MSKWTVGMVMIMEQDKFKVFLKKLIADTENNHFRTTEELIHFTAMELQKKMFVTENR